MLFSDIIGQNDIKKQLIRTVREQRIPHAQLFRGPEGTGKLALAIAYAQYISCENRSETASCGVCPSCVKYNKLVHPDLHFVFPVIKPGNKSSVVCDDFLVQFRSILLKKTYFGVNEWFSAISDDAKQGIIYSNESEEIIRKLNLKTYESDFKVMIIWLPEKMHVSCANKLLKILEEPPEKTIFLLVSNEPDQIISTILSRTQHIYIPRLTDDDITLALLRNNDIEISQEEALHIARISGGSYLNALSAISRNDDNSVHFEHFTTLMRKAWQVGNRKDYAALKDLRKWSEDMASSSFGRERQKDFLNYSQHMIRENFIKNMQIQLLNYLNTQENEFSEKFARYINEKTVEPLMCEFGLAERQIEQNVNAKIIFFDLALKTIVLLKENT